MKGALRAAGALALVAGAANASDTTLKYEVSTDSLHWSTSVTAQPGDRVEVRARVVWTGATQVLAFAGVGFQPVVSGWSSSDVLLTTAGTPGGMGVGPVGGARSTPSANVPDAPGVYGRISPFAFFATTTTSYLRGFVGSGTAAGLLRIAKAYVTNWIGVGPTSGNQSSNNWSGLGGVQPGQIPPSSRIATDPPMNTDLDVVVFKFGFVVGASGAPQREMVIDTPVEGLGRETNPSSGFVGHIFADWYLTAQDAFARRFYDDLSAVPATVHVIPAPSAPACAAVCGLWLARRRCPVKNVCK